MSETFEQLKVRAKALELRLNENERVHAEYHGRAIDAREVALARVAELAALLPEITATLKAKAVALAKVERERDELYDLVRLSEDAGVEEGLFDEEERRSGPNGWDVENEKRWLAERTPHAAPEPTE